jgi:hypothetical protein
MLTDVSWHNHQKEGKTVGQTWSDRLVGIVGVVGLVASSGCAGTGELFYLDIRPKPAMAEFAPAKSVKIVIEPFEDRRSDQTRVGQRTHLWGGVSNFDVVGGKLSEVIAQAMAETLKQHGWHDRGWYVTLAAADGTSLTGADIVIGGQVIECSANAKSRPLSTKIATKSELILRARNAADRTVVSRRVEGWLSDTVFWFEPEDVRVHLAATIKESFARFISDTKIENRSLRSVQ